MADLATVLQYTWKGPFFADVALLGVKGSSTVEKLPHLPGDNQE